jgi:hypothetical protein
MYFAVIIRAGAWSGKGRLGDWSSDDGQWMPACTGVAPSAALALGAYHVIIITNNLRESGTQMPLQERPRLRTSSRPALDLPPPFRLVTLREVGDAFAHATRVAAEEGAGTLVYVGRFDLAEFAVVLEPEEPLKTAPRSPTRSRCTLRPSGPSPSTGRTGYASMAGLSAGRASPGQSAPTRTNHRRGWCSPP